MSYRSRSRNRDILSIMLVCYQNAALVTATGIQREPLVIETRLGRIRPASDAARADQVIDAGAWVLYPALVNAHDHLEFNHYPRTRWRDRYPNARQWAEAFDPQLHQEPFLSLRQLPLPDRCLIGGLKNLFCGVGTVAHHNPPHKALWDKHFPVRVLRQYGWAHSLYRSSHVEIQRAYQQSGRHPFFIHLAEGTDQAASNELTELATLGCLSEKTILIHGVGLKEPHLTKAVQTSGGLVWCPSSNYFLVGETAQVKKWYGAGKLALGSDSRLTANGDLLDELRTAFSTIQLTPPELFHLVTDHAAKLLKLADCGDLKAGMRADVIALPKPAHEDFYRHLIDAQRSDIQWVMREGKILWQQDRQTPNCKLDGVPYRMDQELLNRVKKCQIAEKGLQINL